MHQLGKKKLIILTITDLAIFYLALWTGLFLRYYPQDHIHQFREHIFPFSIIFLVWLLVFSAFGLYDMRFIKNSQSFIYRLAQASIAGLVLAIIILYSIPFFQIEPRRNLLIIGIIAAALTALWRYVFNLFVIRTPATRVIFFGVTKETTELAEYMLKNPQLGQKPVAFVSSGESLSFGGSTLPIVSLQGRKLAEIVADTSAHTIVISPAMKEDKDLVKDLFRVVPLGVTIVEFPAFHEMLTGKIPISLIEEVWFIENLIGKNRPPYEFLKRLIDIILAVILGFATLLLLPFITLGIILSRPRDVLKFREKRARPGDGIFFFRQKRVGKNGEIFDFIKFRSQVLGAERMSAAMNEAKEVMNDPRRYAFGTFMRKSYLDELGQVWNVLKGEMSFIGPRPERPEYVEKLKERVSFYEMRLLVKPGITGWAQINMENDASVEDAPEKMQYDLYYIKNRSLILDLLIALRTVFSILGRRGR